MATFRRYNGNFASFPIGYRFTPHDDELIIHYLAPKIANRPLPPNQIKEVNVYKSDPMQLYEECNIDQGSKSYFFTSRDRKYKNGGRPDRSAGDGYWRATGVGRPIMHKAHEIGTKTTLKYYNGKPPKAGETLRGGKTNWMMYEYMINNPPTHARTCPDDMRLDDTVLCMIYKKKVQDSSVNEDDGKQFKVPSRKRSDKIGNPGKHVQEHKRWGSNNVVNLEDVSPSFPLSQVPRDLPLSQILQDLSLSQVHQDHSFSHMPEGHLFNQVSQDFPSSQVQDLQTSQVSQDCPFNQVHQDLPSNVSFTSYNLGTNTANVNFEDFSPFVGRNYPKEDD